MKGIGNEFERIEEIKTNAQFIIPINFLQLMMYLTPIRPTKWN
jgi:hypothetical protein